MGGTLSAPTIDGEPVTVKVAAATQSGATLRVRERGMPKLHGRGRGDLLVHVRVETPRDLTSRQRELLEELRGTFSGEGKPADKNDGGVFKKIFGS